MGYPRPELNRVKPEEARKRFLFLFFMGHRQHLRIIVLAAAVQLGLSACGKKEPAAVAPDLTMRGAADTVAEAVAVGVKGPLELTLRVYKTKIKSEEESLWYQVQLRNLGAKDIPILDPAFMGPSPVELHSSVGASLWVTGPDGKPLKPAPRPGGGAVLVPGSPSWPIQEGDRRDKATQQKVIDTMFADRAVLRRREEYTQQLEKTKLSEKEIIRRVDKFNEQHPLSTDNAERRPSPHILLKPGASITSVASAQEATPQAGLPLGYTEFWGYWYTKPGKYRIKARFDRRQRGWVVEYDKSHGIPPSEDAVLVETAAIEFEVLP